MVPDGRRTGDDGLLFVRRQRRRNAELERGDAGAEVDGSVSGVQSARARLRGNDAAPEGPHRGDVEPDQGPKDDGERRWLQRLLSAAAMATRRRNRPRQMDSPRRYQRTRTSDPRRRGESESPGRIFG